MALLFQRGRSDDALCGSVNVHWSVDNALPREDHLAIVGCYKLWTRNGEGRIVNSSDLIAHAAMMLLTKLCAVCLVDSTVARH